MSNHDRVYLEYYLYVLRKMLETDFALLALGNGRRVGKWKVFKDLLDEASTAVALSLLKDGKGVVGVERHAYMKFLDEMRGAARSAECHAAQCKCSKFARKRISELVSMLTRTIYQENLHDGFMSTEPKVLPVDYFRRLDGFRGEYLRTLEERIAEEERDDGDKYRESASESVQG